MSSPSESKERLLRDEENQGARNGAPTNGLNDNFSKIYSEVRDENDIVATSPKKQKGTDEEEALVTKRSSSFSVETRAAGDKKVVSATGDKKDAPPPKPKNMGKSMRRLYSYSFENGWLLFFGMVGLAVSSAFMIYMPKMIGHITDVTMQTLSIGSENLHELNVKCIWFLVWASLAAFFAGVRGACFNTLGERVMYRIRRDILASFVRKDTAFYDTHNTGELLSRISSDTATLQMATSDGISMIIRNFIQFIGSFVFLWIIRWDLTLVLFAIVPPLLIVVSIFMKKTKQWSKEYQDKLALASSVAGEAISNIRIVKSFGTEEKEDQRYYNEMTDVYTLGVKRAILYGGFIGVFTVFMFGAILSVLWYGGALVIKHKMGEGDLVSFLLYTMNVSFSLLATGQVFSQIVTAVGVAENLFEKMDEPQLILSGPDRNEDGLQGNIEFRSVHFHYPTKGDVEVLKGVNINIQRGESIAIVGQSGSGKSTIVSLIERFYDVTSGDIIVDGRNVKDYDGTWYHRNIGYVSQEPTLFSNTLRENIVYGVENATDEDVQRAIEMANAAEFIHDHSLFPEGLNTRVGERGVKLSGGQKQRIAIARALIKNPAILIFDEATSALDAESESKVQSAIDNLMNKGDKTIIIIAHRLSTIRYCRRIIVLEHGKVIEEGDHNALLQRNGVYKKLVERQLAGYYE